MFPATRGALPAQPNESFRFVWIAFRSICSMLRTSLPIRWTRRAGSGGLGGEGGSQRPAARGRTLAVLAYVLVLVVAAIFLGVSLVPDRLIIGFVPVILLVGRLRSFIRDWLPFLVALLAYEYLRGLAGRPLARVHFTTMLGVDRALFGVVPTQFLQSHFFVPGHLRWYDYLATLFDFMHFVVPLLVGLLLWFSRPSRFRRFAFAVLLLSLMALATYVGFPAAPPWLAGEDGYLPGVTPVLGYTLQSFPAQLQLPSVYEKFDPDLVAAVPSLHAGYASLTALFLARTYGRSWALLGSLYALGMCVSLVYLGEHYVGDVLLGMLYAGAAFTMTWLVLDRPGARRRESAATGPSRVGRGSPENSGRPDPISA